MPLVASETSRGSVRASRLQSLTACQSSPLKCRRTSCFRNWCASSRHHRKVLDILELEPLVSALQTLRQYYRRVTLERRYEDKSAQNRLPLMMEEVGELARALWSRIFGKSRKPS